MFWSSIRHVTERVSFRLPLSYALLVVVSSAIGYSIIYLMVASYLVKETDTDLLSISREFVDYVRTASLEEVHLEMIREANARGIKNAFLRLLSDRGATLCASDLTLWTDIPVDPSLLERTSIGQPALVTLERDHDGGKVRMLFAHVDPDRVLNIGLSLRDDTALLDNLGRTATVLMLLMVLLGVGVGWGATRRAMKKIESLTCAVTRIADGHFDERVETSRRVDELERLAIAFNRMVQQLQRLMEEMKQVNDSIAHDLRSPLTRMRGVAETTLTGPEDLSEYRSMAASVIEECDRLLSLIKTNLEISEAEAGVTRLVIGKVDLALLVRDGMELFEPIAEDKGITMALKAPEIMPFNGDIRRLQRLLANLLDNAIKYTLSGGTVTVALERHGQEVLLSVRDTGIGISEQDLPRVFDRYFRGDQSRSAEGNGLGLALAQAIARAHGGLVTVQSQLGSGSTFILRLPCRE